MGGSYADELARPPTPVRVICENKIAFYDGTRPSRRDPVVAHTVAKQLATKSFPGGLQFRNEVLARGVVQLFVRLGTNIIKKDVLLQ